MMKGIAASLAMIAFGGRRLDRRPCRRPQPEHPANIPGPILLDKDRVSCHNTRQPTAGLPFDTKDSRAWAPSRTCGNAWRASCGAG